MDKQYLKKALDEQQTWETRMRHAKFAVIRGESNSMSGTNVSLSSGTEGPRYDPYHYDEITVERFGYVMTLHSGLSVWVEVNGYRVNLYGEDYDDGGAQYFEKLTGASPREWMKWKHKLMYERCRRCGSKGPFKSFSGYVGETITCCGKCGQVMYDDFHIGMIE